MLANSNAGVTVEGTVDNRGVRTVAITTAAYNALAPAEQTRADVLYLVS